MEQPLATVISPENLGQQAVSLSYVDKDSVYCGWRGGDLQTNPLLGGDSDGNVDCACACVVPLLFRLPYLMQRKAVGIEEG